MTFQPIAALYRDSRMDDMDVDLVTTRLSWIRSLLPELSDAHQTAPGTFAHTGQGLEVRLTPDGNGVNFNLRSVRDGRYVQFWLITPLGKSTASGMTGFAHWLDVMDAIMATPRAGVARIHDREGEAGHLAKLEAALDDAICILLSENPDYPSSFGTDLILRSPCLGFPGQIFSHKRKPILSKPIEAAILAPCSSLGVIDRSDLALTIKPVEISFGIKDRHRGAVAAASAWRRLGLDRPKNGALVKAGLAGTHG